MDIKSKEQRSYNMSRVKSEGTKPEEAVRKYLFSKGLRYRKNDHRLVGHPDIVLAKYKTVIFVNGCFWHMHEGCKYAVMPADNRIFWEEKLGRNKERDKQIHMQLSKIGWKVIVVWECQLRKADKENTLLMLYRDITNITDDALPF